MINQELRAGRCRASDCGSVQAAVLHHIVSSSAAMVRACSAGEHTRLRGSGQLTHVSTLAGHVGSHHVQYTVTGRSLVLACVEGSSVLRAQQSVADLILTCTVARCTANASSGSTPFRKGVPKPSRTSSLEREWYTSTACTSARERSGSCAHQSVSPSPRLQCPLWSLQVKDAHGHCKTQSLTACLPGGFSSVQRSSQHARCACAFGLQQANTQHILISQACFRAAG